MYALLAMLALGLWAPIDDAPTDVSLDTSVSSNTNLTASLDNNLSVAADVPILPMAGATGPDEEASTKGSDIADVPAAAVIPIVAVVAAGAALAFWSPLKALVLGLLAPLFSRIDRTDLLDLSSRQRVHDVVASNPGVTIKEVASLTGLGWGTTVYHLGRLEAERVLVSQRQRQFRRYFLYGGAVANDDKMAVGELLGPLPRQLAEHVRGSPGQCQKDLCEAFGIRPSLAHKHLERLVAAGLLTREREWKLVRYYPTSHLAGVLPLMPATAAANTIPASTVPAFAIPATTA